MVMQMLNNKLGAYKESLNSLTEGESRCIEEAIGVLESRIRKGLEFTSPVQVKRYCQLNLAMEPDEVFACLFLDSKHRLISFERIFRGTVNSASVYPRVIVRKVIELNAVAVIFAHNHPSGNTEPSQADIDITSRLKQSLELIDVRVLDHIVVGTQGECSLAEKGLI